MTEGHGLAGVADAGAFLARLVRLDPGALVRLRTASTAGHTTLWARLPWSVLVSRTVPGSGPGDAVVSAADLLAELARGGPALPPRRDVAWRWPLPPPAGRIVETVPVAELRQLAAAAAGAVRAAAVQGVRGRTVGQRAVRDALLDHVAIVVTEQAEPAGQADSAGTAGTTVGSRIEVPQRLVQAVVQMGFLGPVAGSVEATNTPQPVQVRLNGKWLALSAWYGIAWLRTVGDLGRIPGIVHPKGG